MKIEELAMNTLQSLKNAIDTGSVVGKPITIEGTVIVPVSRVTFAFLAGGGEYSESSPKVVNVFPYASGSGGGANVTPVGFLVFFKEKYEYISIDKQGEGKWGDLIEASIKLLKSKN